MAAKKSSKGAVGKKKTAAGKDGAKKKTAAKRPATAKKAAAESKPAARKAGPKKKTAAKAGAPRTTPVPKPESTEPKPKAGFSSMNVNLGHVFSLRPTVSKSFRQADFLTARHLLQDESYASIEEAARAVVEKALDMTREGPSKRGFKPGR